jgi:hypothetical protein
MNTVQSLTQFVNCYFQSALTLRQVRDKTYEKLDKTISTTTVRRIWIDSFGQKRYCERRLNLRGYDEQKERAIRKYKRRNFRIVKLRDRVCQECGCDSEQLDVHHIVPRRLFERYDLEQHDEDNLILLCKKCHATMGQELDNTTINIFETCIKIANPVLADVVLQKLQQQKIYRPKRQCGAPAKYIMTKADVVQFKNDQGLVDVDLVKEKFFDVPIHHIVKVCRRANVAFTMKFNNETKIMQVKTCPCCNWSGGIKFINHIFNTNDVSHQQLLDDIRQLYLSGKSCGDIAEIYKNNNFTTAIVKDIVNRLGVMKPVNLVDRSCPVCGWSGLTFNKHFMEMTDERHADLRSKILKMYFDEHKSTTLISITLDIDKKFVYGFIQKHKKVGKHEVHNMQC